MFQLLKDALARISNQLLLFSIAVILCLYFFPAIRGYTVIIYFVAVVGYLCTRVLKIKKERNVVARDF
jgi:hypothetical protein